MTNRSQQFWDFSVELYNKERVAESCLALQDSLNIDVNMLLFCCWYAKYYGAVEQELLQRLLHYSHNWKQSVVQPLRDIRLVLKTMDNNEAALTERIQQLRENIKREELAAENIQQSRIEKLVFEFDAEERVATATDLHLRGDAASNIHLLFELESIEQTTTSPARIETILASIAD